LLAAGIKPGDEVITVSHTFFATIESILHCGATPVLVDIKEDFLIDVNKIEKLITSKTKAIIPVHLNGRVCEMDSLMEIAEKYNLKVIEDAAQSIGGKFNGKMAGSFGLVGCFSFYPAKILGAMGDGGLVSTNDASIAEKIRLYRNHGQKTKTEIVLSGWTSRLDNFQAAILNVKLTHLSNWIQRRREIADKYFQGLSKIKNVKLPSTLDSDEKHFDVYQNYVIRAEKRDLLFQFLKDNNIETLIKDPIPNHKQPAINFVCSDLSNTEKFADEVISLPMYPELTNEQVDFVISCVCNFFNQ